MPPSLKTYWAQLYPPSTVREVLVDTYKTCLVYVPEIKLTKIEQTYREAEKNYDSE